MQKTLIIAVLSLIVFTASAEALSIALRDANDTTDYTTWEVGKEKALDKYCDMDTKGMVEIVEALRKGISGTAR